MLSIAEYEEFLAKKDKRKAKQGWRFVGGKRIYFRSTWEANYGRYLQFLVDNHQIAYWLHEPKTFWFEAIKRGVRTYLPDFQVFDFLGNHHWVEVKGFMDAKSQTKLKRFAKYYPDEKLTLIDKTWFKENNKQLKSLINDWE